MKRITLVLGLVAVMAAMIVALAAPALAKDNDGHKGGGNNRLDNRLDRLDNQRDFLVSDVDFSPVFTTNEGLADELCSPLSSDVINNAIPGCIFGDRNDDLNVDYYGYYPYWSSSVDSDSNIDVDFDRGTGRANGFVNWDKGVDFDFDRGAHFTNGNNHNGNAHHDGNNHDGGAGKKENGK